jgi:hypothetical protein
MNVERLSAWRIHLHVDWWGKPDSGAYQPGKPAAETVAAGMNRVPTMVRVSSLNFIVILRTGARHFREAGGSWSPPFLLGYLRVGELAGIVVQGPVARPAQHLKIGLALATDLIDPHDAHVDLAVARDAPTLRAEGVVTPAECAVVTHASFGP